MFRRVSSLILLFIFLSTVLTGCYDSREIDDEVYTLAVGIDKGVNNKLRITIQYPVYKSEGSGGGGEQGGGKMDSKGGGANSVSGTNLHTIESSTILEALDMFGMAISRRVSMMHTKAIVFSEEVAKEGVRRFLEPMSRFRETRRIMNVVVVKGNAEEFLKENKSNIGESLSKAMELMFQQAENTYFFPRVTFHDFYRNLISHYEQGYAAYTGINNFNSLSSDKESKGEPPLVIDKGFEPGELPREGVTKREYVGTAVFHGDKMVGTLNSYETRYLGMVTGKFKRGILDLIDKNSPDNAILLDVRPSRAPQVKGRFENGTPVIDVKVRLEADIGAIQSRINYESKDRLEELTQYTSGYIKENIQKLVNKVQKEYKSDIFGFGKKIAGYFLTIQEWEKYNWLSHFPDAKVNVKVELEIRRTGLMIRSSPVK